MCTHLSSSPHTYYPTSTYYPMKNHSGYYLCTPFSQIGFEDKLGYCILHLPRVELLGWLLEWVSRTQKRGRAA